MDFELSEDQLALRAAARELLDDLARPGRVRAVVDAGGGRDDELWKAMAGQGWMGVEVPEEQGGLGLGMVEAAVLLEEVGRHAAPAPFLSSFLALGGLARAAAGGVDGAAPWLEPLTSGQAVGTVAWDVLAAVLYGPSADVVLAVAGAEVLRAVVAGARRTRCWPGRRRRCGGRPRLGGSWPRACRCAAASASRGRTTSAGR